jgi:hypothetical protein
MPNINLLLLKGIFVYSNCISLIQYYIIRPANNLQLINYFYYVFSNYYIKIKNLYYNIKNEPDNKSKNINIDNWTSGIFPCMKQNEISVLPNWGNISCLQIKPVKFINIEVLTFLNTTMYFIKAFYKNPFTAITFKKTIDYAENIKNCNVIYDEKYFYFFMPVVYSFDKKLLNPPTQKNIVYNSVFNSYDKMKIHNELNIVKKQFTSKLQRKLFTIKYDNYYYFKLINRENVDRNDILINGLIASNVSFMTIEYFHSSLKEPFQIDLTKYNLSIGSEILDPIFIQRYIEYNYGSKYTFSLGYILNIIDCNFNLFKLKDGQYLKLGLNNYSVKNLSDLNGD